MLREYRFAAAPKWMAGHLIVLALAIAMALLGHWQLTVSEAKHFSLQNFGYALQWWAFALFGIGMWLRVIRDVRRHQDHSSTASQQAEAIAVSAAPVTYRRYVMPQTADGPPPAMDAEHAAYNEYLAGLADKPAGKESQ